MVQLFVTIGPKKEYAKLVLEFWGLSLNKFVGLEISIFKMYHSSFADVGTTSFVFVFLFLFPVEMSAKNINLASIFGFNIFSCEVTYFAVN